MSPMNVLINMFDTLVFRDAEGNRSRACHRVDGDRR